MPLSLFAFIPLCVNKKSKFKSYNGVSRKLIDCLKFKECLKKISWKFQVFFKTDSKFFQECSKGGSGMTEGCLKRALTMF